MKHKGKDKKSVYRAVDIDTLEVVAEGSPKEVSEKIGITNDYVWGYWYRQFIYNDRYAFQRKVGDEWM